jgi:ADP-heptose:LPS heptosyltransferase
LASVKNIQFISVQSGQAPQGMNLIDFHSDLQDFADVAGLLHHLDLLISVDTAPAHLAGAMAKPVWTLIPCRSDPRWLLGRSDSPWYPTMRLFRQTHLQSLREPIVRMKEQLEQLAENREPA